MEYRLLDNEDSVHLNQSSFIDGNLSKSQNNRFLGIFYVMIGSVFFTLMVASCKLAYQHNPQVNGFDYVLIRSTSLCLLSGLQLAYERFDIFDVKEEYRFAMLCRCIAGGLGMPSFFIALKYIPSSKATLILNIHPMLVAVAAYYLLGESITKDKVFAVIGAFIGVVLLSHHEGSADSINYYIGISLTSFTWLWATVVVIAIRVLNQHVHYALSPFWFGVTTSIMSILVLIFIPSAYNFSHYTFYDISFFLVSGIFNYLGQTCKSLSLKYEDASFISPFLYFQVLYLFIWDLLIFNYSFTLMDIMGSLLITVCLLLPVFLK